MKTFFECFMCSKSAAGRVRKWGGEGELVHSEKLMNGKKRRRNNCRAFMKRSKRDGVRTNATSMTDDKLLIFAIRVGMKQHEALCFRRSLVSMQFLFLARQTKRDGESLRTWNTSQLQFTISACVCSSKGRAFEWVEGVWGARRSSTKTLVARVRFNELFAVRQSVVKLNFMLA